MRVSMTWVRDWVELPADISGREVAERLIAAGLEVESVETVGAGLDGDLTVGRVVDIEELTGFKKPIRWCQVDLGPDHGGVRGIVCGASNFIVDDHVAVAIPGTQLPGGFLIAARETYGHISDGMICSERELGLGDDHAGIMVLSNTETGVDAKALLGIGDEILDIAVTPDRGYALSIRGVAREVATAFGIDFHDRAMDLVDLPAPAVDAMPWPCDVDDARIAELFTLRRVVGFNPAAHTPAWIRRRINSAGMRPVSLAVDVTNYVMLETGQPLHAFDGAKLRGAVRASWAGSHGSFTTLDHVKRTLQPDDIVIRDESGPLGLAGIMGGLTSEIGAESTDIVLEAAWFVSSTVAKSARRHRLSSEASRRFERGVDRVLAPYASARAAQLLLAYGGGSYVGLTAWESPYEPTVISLAGQLPARTGGLPIESSVVKERLEAVGCEVGDNATGGSADNFAVVVPPWRPDLIDPADLVEEVLRLGGYDVLPSVLPVISAGRGLTAAQRIRRRVGISLAGIGVTDVLTYPFIGDVDLDACLIASEDSRRRTVVLANPINDEQPFLRSTLIPGLLGVLRRNTARGVEHVAVSEIGRVFTAAQQISDGGVGIRPSVSRRPSQEEVSALESLLPIQPYHVAAVLSGERMRSGWWGSGQDYIWADAIEIATMVGREAGVSLSVEASQYAPWHPGRTAALSADGHTIGYAGEIDPRVLGRLGLPPRTCAFELDLSRLTDLATMVQPAPQISSAPVAKEDLALVVDHEVAASDVAAAIRDGGGVLVESVRLFDVYAGPQVPAGKRSLAFALRLRAEDRTLTAEEITRVRNDAIAAAEQRCGAVLR